MKVNLNYTVGFGLLLVFSSIFTNPRLPEYESYEMKRFKGLYETTSQKSNRCSKEAYRAYGDKLSSFDEYKFVCTEVISKFENNSEKLLATIRGNTRRNNFLLFSTYKTSYSEVYYLVEDAIKNHPNHRKGNTITSYGGGGFVVGIFGFFLDLRYGNI